MAAAAARLPHLKPPLQSASNPVYDSLVRKHGRHAIKKKPSPDLDFRHHHPPLAQVSCYDSTQNANIVLFVPANVNFLTAIVDCVFDRGLVRHEARIALLCASFADVDAERATTILKSIGKYRSARPRAHWVRTESLLTRAAPKPTAARSSDRVTLTHKQLAQVKQRSVRKGVTQGFQQSRQAHQQVLDQFAAVNWCVYNGFIVSFCRFTFCNRESYCVLLLRVDSLTGTQSGTDRQRRLWNALGKSVFADAAPGRRLATMAGHIKGASNKLFPSARLIVRPCAFLRLPPFPALHSLTLTIPCKCDPHS